MQISKKKKIQFLEKKIYGKTFLTFFLYQHKKYQKVKKHYTFFLDANAYSQGYAKTDAYQSHGGYY